MGEAQDVFAVAVQAVEQVARRGLFDHAAFAGRGRARRVVVVALGDDLLVACAVAGQLAGIQPGLASGLCARDGAVREIVLGATPSIPAISPSAAYQLIYF